MTTPFAAGEKMMIGALVDLSLRHPWKTYFAYAAFCLLFVITGSFFESLLLDDAGVECLSPHSQQESLVFSSW
jgi:hypothetical protein